MATHRIYGMSFASVYVLYVAKVEKKGRTKAELDEVITWLTGYDDAALQAHLDAETLERAEGVRAELLGVAAEDAVAALEEHDACVRLARLESLAAEVVDLRVVRPEHAVARVEHGLGRVVDVPLSQVRRAHVHAHAHASVHGRRRRVPRSCCPCAGGHVGLVGTLPGRCASAPVLTRGGALPGDTWAGHVDDEGEGGHAAPLRRCRKARTFSRSRTR
mgnify:CR=1 FL=1